MYKDPNYQRKYYLRHKKVLINRMKLYAENNAKKIKEYNVIYGVKYRLTHKRKIAEYRKNHKAKHNEYKKIYIKNKLKTNVNFKLRMYLRSRIWSALKRNIKSAKTMKLIGCNIADLKIYLQKKFTKGMSWDNYGKWHVDHIKPCSAFDLSKPREQRKCFNWRNLQPLWAKDNYAKRKQDNLWRKPRKD